MRFLTRIPETMQGVCLAKDYWRLFRQGRLRLIYSLEVWGGMVWDGA